MCGVVQHVGRRANRSGGGGRGVPGDVYTLGFTPECAECQGRELPSLRLRLYPDLDQERPRG